MGRLKLVMPEKFTFTSRIPLRIVDLNYAGHLGNDTLLSILHEARIQFLSAIGCSETDSCGKGLIQADAGLVYWAETFYGDILTISMVVADFTLYGFDLYYLVTTQRDDKEVTVAKAKTLMIFFDYGSHKKAMVPDAFKQKILELERQFT
jgi:acyl-CoA thioester hydrolase